MSFTPGPWKLETAPKGANDGWQISSNNTSRGKGRYVILATRGPIDGEEFAGNARIIVAAPEMYELLDDAMTELASIVNNYELTEEDTRDAIAVCKKFDALWRRIKGEEETK